MPSSKFVMKTYQNPVLARESADPYALYYNGAYYLYRTGLSKTGRIFGILRSYDLIHWKDIGGAMGPLLEGFTQYWAPEVIYENGVFFLYYAAGKNENMHLRVAQSSRPEGPFLDSGLRLTSVPFAIDPHVFIDKDETRYLFYATDFLERERTGTGIVMDKLKDPYTLEGNPTPVTLAQYDWQIFDPQRQEKGGVCWHTVEGPFVLRHKDRYYEMFSAGNFQKPSYGVGYAVTDHLGDGAEWTQMADGEHTQPLLHSIPGKVTGPGHNSVVLGPDHRQWFCVYHEIKPQKELLRVLAVDRLEWVGDRLAVLGPSYTPQPSPIDAERLITSPLSFDRQGRVNKKSFQLASPGFLIDSWASSSPDGNFGFRLAADWRSLLRMQVNCAEQKIVVMGRETDDFPLPRGFRPQAVHNYALEMSGKVVILRADSTYMLWGGVLPEAPDTLEVYWEGGDVEISSLEVTYGFEDNFTIPNVSFDNAGWSVSGEGQAQMADNLLRVTGPFRLEKPLPLVDYEWVVNFRIAQGDSLSFFPALDREGKGVEVRLTGGEQGWPLQVAEEAPVSLSCDPRVFQQLRFWKQRGSLRISLLDQVLGDWPIPPGESSTGLGVPAGVDAEFDLVRVTKIV